MADGGLDYPIQKKLDTQYLRDMTQLADRVQQVERHKAEKARTSKLSKKENVAYVDTDDIESGFDLNFDDVKNSEVNLAELKLGPPFTCKVLRLSNSKNPEEPTNEKYPLKMDSVQKALDEGRLMFGDKSNKPMQIDVDPLKQVGCMYVEIADVNVIETTESVAESFGKPKNANKYQKEDVVMVTEDHI
ncbi:hypothetical protein MTR_6g038450 [Medicago truncatula]|uniref:Uncharacterized protein n=1 Tax=Medicago truncatula TaxID=3880 RepID=A0A072U8I6_MEDTR|nr:hypothetical protein MTR_6g038450 [Medicago truncatula]